jgi:ribonuclease T2
VAQQSFDNFGRRKRRRKRSLSVAGLVAAALTTLLYRCSQSPNQATAPAKAPSKAASSAGRFDFYLLDLTHEAAWCEDGNGRRDQCQRLDSGTANKRPLVLHGLWPENLAAGAYPANCAAGALKISSALRSRLEWLMPGAAEGLDQHEWRKHGGCTGLDAERYFAAAADWTERVAKTLDEPVRAAAGGSTSAAALRARIAAADPALAESVVFMCKNLRTANPQNRRKPYLISVRVCLDREGAGGAPGGLLRCESVQRRDQGCGREFFIDDIRE